MTEGSNYLPIFPRAVRKDEIEQAPLLAWGLTFEQGLSVTGEFENPNALIHVGLLGLLVAFDLAQAAALFLAPLPGHPVEEVAADLAIELIDIHCLNAALEAVGFREEPPKETMKNWRFVVAVIG